MDGNSSTPRRREYSEPRNSQNSTLRAMLIDHVKIGPVTEIDVCESAGALVKEVQVASRNMKILGAYLTRCWAAHNTIYPSRYFTPKIMEPCFRLSLPAAGDQAMPKPRIMSVGFSHRKWRIILATKRFWIQMHFQTIHKYFYDTEVVMKLTEQHDGHTFWHS